MKPVLDVATELATLNEQLEDRDREHTQRLDGLAHDFKNPLVLIANAFEQCSWRLTSEQLAAPEFTRVRAEVEWMIKFVDHMLDLARAEAGRTALRKQLVYVEELVADAAHTLDEFAAHQNRRIIVHPGSEELALIADEGLLFKLMTLLLSRAVRLTSAVVDVRTTTSLDGSTIFVDIVVDPLDVGRAKPRELFDRFSRPWSHHDDRQFGITGLEMSVAQWITEAHGGALKIAEADHQRTVIRASFPRATPRPSSWSARSRSEAA